MNTEFEEEHSDLVSSLIKDEELRLFPYRDTKNLLTIGVGRNLETNGISKTEALYLLENDIESCRKDLEGLFGPLWKNFSPVRRNVFLNMRFHLGFTGFKRFKKMIAAAKKEDFIETTNQMMDSVWYERFPNRAERLCYEMRRG